MPNTPGTTRQGQGTSGAGADGGAPDPSARERFVQAALAAIPREIVAGPHAAHLRVRLERLADAVLIGDAYFRRHNVHRDEDIVRINDAAAAVTALDGGFTLSDVDEHRREKASARWLDTVNLLARLGGETLHEGMFDGEAWRTWNREVTVYPKDFARPEPPDRGEAPEALYAPVQAVVTRASVLRVVGGGHSFNESSSTGGTKPAPQGTLLSLDAYDRWHRLTPSEYATFGLTEERGQRTVRVQAGIRLRDFTRQLWDEGLAMPVAGSTNVQSLGGLLATDLHGTGRHHGFLSECLLEVALVTASGRLVRFRKTSAGWRTDEPQPQTFRHLPVAGALGMLGVVVELVLTLDPAYNLAKHIQFVDRQQAEADLPRLLRDNDHVSFYYPGGLPDARTVRMQVWNRTEQQSEWTARFKRFVHEVTDHALTSFAPKLLADIGTRDACTDPLITRLNREGPSILPAPLSFARQLFFQHDEIEYGLPVGRFAACLDEVMRLLVAEEFRTIIELRFTPDTSEAVLGPGTAGRGQGGAAFIELATPLGQYSDARIAEVHQKFHEVLRRHGGRPHLGKKSAVTGAEMQDIYGEDWTQFQALRRRWDPGDKLLPPDNLFLQKIFA
jgi:FAD/FMN-containing dehydrogenase